MRVRVLPRATAAEVITGSISRVGWAFAAGTVVLTIPVLVETLVARGRMADLPLPVLLLGVVLGAVVAVAVHPRVWVVLGFYLVAGGAAIGYQVALLAADPMLADDAVYLLNRPLLALVAVGVATSSAVAGIAWVTVAYLIATGAGLAAAALAGVGYRPGWGPTMVIAVTVVAHLTLAAIQYRMRRRVPNFDELEAETLGIAHGRDLARRTTAVVHDTLLGDLAVVLNAPDRLDDRTRDRLRADLDTLRSAEWISAAAVTDRLSDTDAGLRNELSALASEYQWRGLSIQVTGSATADHRLEPAVADAVFAAVRASLDNVAQHAHAASAEIEVIVEAGTVTVMVTDQGSGFDVSGVGDDRLGLRASIRDRIESVGGTAQVWSSPGAGTSVMLTVPSLPARETAAPR